MKKSLQRGAISTGAIIALGMLGLIIAAVGAFVWAYISYANYGNRTEENLRAIRENNKNIYATYTQKVMEVAQVPAMARDDILKVVTASMQGRYGADGSKATFQMLREQNPNIDPKLYTKIQQVIEAGRNDFQKEQTNMIAAVQSYKTALGEMPGSFFIRMAGYPKLDFNDFKPITTDRTEDVYKAGKESGPLQLR